MRPLGHARYGLAVLTRRKTAFPQKDELRGRTISVSLYGRFLTLYYSRTNASAQS